MTLFSNGNIRFDYGTGNANLTPTVGLSLGVNNVLRLSQYDGLENLSNVAWVEFNAEQEGVDIGAYEFLGNPNDTTPAVVVSTTPGAINSDGTVDGISGTITVTFSKQLNPIDANAPAEYQLDWAGPDGILGTADDVIYPLTPSYTLGSNTVTLSFAVPPGGLPAGEYSLTIYSDANRSLHDLEGIDLDGDDDGTPGGDFVRIFDVEPAGFIVTPTSGLITTNVGGTATFDVSLASEPTADVSIGLSSSDPAVGTEAPTSLEFTPLDWNVPQVVTVTGQSGQTAADVDYMIVLAAAVSDDPNYSGLVANSVSVTNQLIPPPGAPTDLAISPDTGASSSDGITDTGTLTLTGSLSASGLTVEVFDETAGVQLANATVKGTSLSESLSLAGGTHDLRVIAVDSFGQKSAPADLIVQVVLTRPQVTALRAVTGPRNTPVSSDVVTFSEPIDPATLETAGAVSLTLNGNAVTITGLTFTAGSGNTYQIGGLAQLTTAEGSYDLSFDGTKIADIAGNAGTGSVSTSWLMDTTSPVSKVGSLPAQTTSTSFLVTVSASDPNGSDGGAPSGVASMAIYDSEDDGTFGFFATVTTADPSAEFTGQAGHTYGFFSIATDNAGNVEATPAAPQATVQILYPLSISSIAAVSPNPRHTPVSTIDVTFNLPIDTSSPTTDAVTLTDNGNSVPLSDLTFTLVAGTTSTYEVGDLSAFTAASGTYQFTINAAGIQDQYGNAGAGSLSTSWVLSGAAVPTISWSDPADIVYGTALSGTQLDATANVQGTFTYTPAAGTVPGAGNDQTLSVTFMPTDTTDYTTASATVMINVARATPSISWTDPADIVYGTALSGTQLDATANVQGNLTYTPASGTVLGAGIDQTLSVSFAPTDSTDYTTASDTVMINVARATPSISWSNPADIVYGTALSGTQLDAHRECAGDLHLHACRGDRARRRQQPDALRQLRPH